MKRFKKFTVSQVKAVIKKQGFWEGLIVGNKVRQFHFLDGWHLGNKVKFNSIEELIETSNNMLYYLDKQLGNRIAYYTIEG